ncbi:protein arginine n-methyltransferase 10-like [Nannochloropsis oceanica]
MSSSSSSSSSDTIRLLPAHANILASVQEARAAWRGRRDAAAAAQGFLRIVQEVPSLLRELEVELGESLGAYANELYQEGAMPTALWLMDNATRSMPSSKILAYEQGCLFFRARQYLPALDAFQRALRIDPGYFAALDALENIKNLSLDRWHFRMLNDLNRNTTYQLALRRVLLEETIRLGRAPKVMDIGTGTGLLAYLAIEAGAGKVIACETNPVLCAVASDLLCTKEDRVQILNQSSYDIQLDGPVDVVVTELVDSGLLGEHVLPVLRHARKHMLRPGGRVIPHAAVVYARVIESTEVRRRSRLLKVDGVKSSWWGGRDSGCEELSEGGRNSKSSSDGSTNKNNDENKNSLPNVRVDETYTCESLTTLQHRCLTEAVAVIEIPLSHPPARANDASDASLTEDINLEVIADGQADAVAMWFDLILLPSDVEADRCAFSTDPERKGNGWDQGIYFLHASHVVRRGQRCRLRVAVIQDQLSFKLVDGDTIQSSSQSSSPSSTSVPVEVGEMDMSHLNDTHHIQAYRQALYILTSRVEKDRQPITAVVEWSGNYSVLGFVAASVPTLQSAPVTIVTGNEDSAAALRTWGQQGLDTPLCSVHVISSIDDKTGSKLMKLLPQALFFPPDQNSERAAPPSHHVLVIHDLVECSGWLRQGAIQEARLLQSVLNASTATTTASLLPVAVSVFVQGLEAPALLRQNRLEPENLLGFPAGRLLDGLGVRKFQGLDLNNTVEHRPVTAITRAFRVDMRSLIGTSRQCEEEKKDLKEVVARSRVELPVTVAAPGATLHAVSFWFSLHLTTPRTDGGNKNDDGVTFNTGPTGPGQEETSYRQGAILVGAISIVAGQLIELEVVWSVSRGIDMVVLGIV